MTKIDIAILTRKQATLYLHENLSAEEVASGLAHKNYHIRIQALLKLEFPLRIELPLRKKLKSQKLSEQQILSLLERELHAPRH